MIYKNIEDLVEVINASSSREMWESFVNTTDLAMDNELEVYFSMDLESLKQLPVKISKDAIKRDKSFRNHQIKKIVLEMKIRHDELHPVMNNQLIMCDPRPQEAIRAALLDGRIEDIGSARLLIEYSRLCQQEFDKRRSTISTRQKHRAPHQRKTPNTRISDTYRILNYENIANGYYEDIGDSHSAEVYWQIDGSKWQAGFYQKRNVLQNGDIVLAAHIENNKTIVIYNHDPSNGNLIAGPDMIILRGKNAAYVSTYLSTDSGKRQFYRQLKKNSERMIKISSAGDFQIDPVTKKLCYDGRIYIEGIQKIQVPIIPISDLELASANKLNRLAENELTALQEKYRLLKIEYQKKRPNNLTVPYGDQLARMEQTLQEVLNEQRNISQNIEIIKSSLSELLTEFVSIKSLPREIDVKLSRLNDSIDNKLSRLLADGVKIESYIKEIRSWFDDFDFLESKSQKYLPQAEFIFDQIHQLEDADYSPFILQYCRALENELLKKIFRSYIQSLIERDIEITTEFEWDFSRKESGNPNSEDTFKLAKKLKSCLKKPEEGWFFELGSMEVNLRNLTGKTAEKSPLLIDLKNFVLDRFEKEILNIDFLDEIKTITRDYRNQSAHPNLIDTEKALRFHKEMKECLIGLMANYKK